jgi:hypothetical protein
MHRKQKYKKIFSCACFSDKTGFLNQEVLEVQVFDKSQLNNQKVNALTFEGFGQPWSYQVKFHENITYGRI